MSVLWKYKVHVAFKHLSCAKCEWRGDDNSSIDTFPVRLMLGHVRCTISSEAQAIIGSTAHVAETLYLHKVHQPTTVLFSHLMGSHFMRATPYRYSTRWNTSVWCANWSVHTCCSKYTAQPTFVEDTMVSAKLQMFFKPALQSSNHKCSKFDDGDSLAHV